MLEDGASLSLIAEYLPPQRVACGSTHTFVLKEVFGNGDGGAYRGCKVFGWGGNRQNPLGMRPQAKHKGSDSRKWDTEVVSATDEVFCNQHPEIPHEEFKEHAHEHQEEEIMNLFEVACGANHSVVLSNTHPNLWQDNSRLLQSEVWSFGLKSNGRLGRAELRAEGGDDDESHLPKQVTIKPLPAFPLAKPIVQRITCGVDHTLAIVNFGGENRGAVPHVQGRVFAWGLGSYGALGTPSRQDEWEPTEVWFPSDFYHEEPLYRERRVQVQQVAAGTKHSIALDSNGRVYTWGHGGNGRLGLGRQNDSFTAAFQPAAVAALGETKSSWVAAGEAHTGVIDQLGGLYTWGQGSHGRCGHGNALDITTPSRVETLIGIAVSQVAFGLHHSVATTVKGYLFAWGKGPATGLDPSDNVVIQMPTKVELPDFQYEKIHQVACGPLHTVVLMQEGTIFIFGSGSEGRLGNNSRAGGGKDHRDQPFPRKIRGAFWSEQKCLRASGKETVAEVVSRPGRDTWPEQVGCGGANSAVVLKNGEVWVWGSDCLTKGAEMKDGEETQTFDAEHKWFPCLMKRGFTATNVIRTISIGHRHCLAIDNRSIMYSWGEGGKGQLGTGSLNPCTHPAVVTSVEDVTAVSAGEEHSAAISEGGELHTWGAAEGGKLGLGSCLTEGLQMLPMLAKIERASKASNDVRLKGVACGSQHTAFVSDDDKLLTCGVGWFGRLGHGNMENQYSPTFVEHSALRVAEVHCAMYHTCLVDTERVLWVFGRGTCLCRGEHNHLLSPEKFAPFLEAPRRLVTTLATSEQHTLVVTLQEGQKSPHELWVWGRNTCGVLGVPQAQATRIDMPWQLHIPGTDRHGRDKILKVVAAAGHCLALVQPRRPDAPVVEGVRGERPPRPPPDLYAWGLTGSGRLGIKIPTDGDDVPALKFLTAGKNDDVDISQRVRFAKFLPPMRVEASWRKAEEDSANKGPLDSGKGPSSHQKAETWLDVQKMLFNEEPEKKRKKLIEKEKDVEKNYELFIKDIFGLWDTPEEGSTKITEHHIRSQERDIEKEYLRTLRALELGGSHNAPRLEDIVKTQDEIQQKIHLWDELLWILQQQPLFLSNLALRLTAPCPPYEWIAPSKAKEVTDNVKECQLFGQVTAQIFGELSDDRTRQLFKALLRVMISNEMKRADSIDELFDPVHSRVLPLVTQLVTSPCFAKSFAAQILDPAVPDSLINIIINHTISRDGKPHPPDKPVRGLFVTNAGEYSEQMAEALTARHAGMHQLSAFQSQSRQAFNDEMRKFQDLCIEKKEEEQGAGAVKLEAEILKFVQRLIADVLKKDDNKDLQMLLTCIFSNLLQQRYVIPYKNENDDSWKPDICGPVAAVVLAGMIGGVLESFELPQYAMLRLKIRKEVKKREQDVIDTAEKAADEGGETGKAYDNVQDPGLPARVEWNLHALSRFFYRIVHRDVFSSMYAAVSPDGLEVEMAKVLKQTACERLMSVLAENAQGVRAYSEDETETQLTVNLYTAHYSLAPSRIWLSTGHLLELTNMLWKYMEADQHDSDTQPIRITTKEDDRVYQLVDQILPEKKKEDLDDERVWKMTDVLIANVIGEWHNFTMRPRFLEFSRTGMCEPTFSEISQAPVPRVLTREGQRKRKGVRAVKPFRVEEKGPCLDIPNIPNGDNQYPYEDIEALLQDLSGMKADAQGGIIKYAVSPSAKTFQDLRSSFEEFQRRIASELEDGPADALSTDLLQRLDYGKHMIDKIREGFQENELKTYIDRQQRERASYHKYLQLIETGVRDIRAAQEGYQNNLLRFNKTLTEIFKVSLTSDLPDMIVSTAQSHSERLTFLRVKRIKAKDKRTNRTPAQIVLDELVKNSEFGKATEELRASVGMPSRTFSLKQLTSKGVVMRVHDDIPKQVRKLLEFTFRFDNDEYMVQAYMKTTLLKEFVITRQDQHLMTCGRKTATLDYGEGFVFVSCFRLKRLLAQIQVEGGL